MIISFQFANYRSYKDTQFFTMERPQDIKLHHDSFVPNSEGVHNHISLVAAVYGANASGKSGFVSALKSLQESVTDGQVVMEPFRLCRNADRAQSTYSIVFIANNRRKYQYDLRACRGEVVYESLAVWESQKPSVLFERITKKHQSSFDFGSKFTSMQIAKIVREESRLAADKPLLSFLGQFNEEVTRPAYEFFERGMYFCDARHYDILYNRAKSRIVRDPSLRDVVNRLLPAVDLGIESIEIDAPPEFMIDRLARNFPGMGKELLTRRYTELVFRHAGEEGDCSLGKIQESQGTIAAIALLLMIYDAIKSGTVCIVDELDASLHPLLVAQLVEVFNTSRANPKGAQLVFTTHDTALIEKHSDLDALDRDQIWFAEKNRSGRSQLYPLTSIKTPREDVNIGVKYLHGRYGATPNISLLDQFIALHNYGEADVKTS